MNTVTLMILRRIGLGFATMIVISVMIFLGMEALPGDVAEAILGQQATPETVKAFRKELKLDLRPHIRYFSWLGDFLQGDMGNSLANGRPIAGMIGWRFSNTLFLAGATAVIAVPLAIILGILAALYRETWFDRTLSVATLGAVSVPEFFIAYILIALLSVKLGMFPSISGISTGMSFGEKIHGIMLPCLTLTLVSLAHIMRMTRAAIINLLTSPYIEMAHLKGINPGRIITHHAFPNALSPIINVVILNLAYLVVGVVVVEVVFVYPGLGQLLVDSVSKRDIPVVQASGLIFACTYVFLNLLADVLSIIANPKLRNM